MLACDVRMINSLSHCCSQFFCHAFVHANAYHETESRIVQKKSGFPEELYHRRMLLNSQGIYQRTMGAPAWFCFFPFLLKNSIKNLFHPTSLNTEGPSVCQTFSIVDLNAHLFTSFICCNESNQTSLFSIREFEALTYFGKLILHYRKELFEQIKANCPRDYTRRPQGNEREKTHPFKRGQQLKDNEVLNKATSRNDCAKSIACKINRHHP